MYKIEKLHASDKDKEFVSTQRYTDDDDIIDLTPAGRQLAGIYCSSPDDEVMAAKAYNEYAKAAFGEFAFLNKIEETQ